MMDQRALEALRRSGRRTDLRRAVRYMRTNPVLLFWTTAFLGIILASIFAPVVATHDPQDQTNPLLLNPGAEHWMGTDELGRDIYSRIVYGGRTSLTVGLIAVSIALIVGTTVGLVSGFAGGLVEAVMMRFVDALMAFPSILLAIFIIALLGSGLVNMMIAIGISAIPWYARTARGSTLSVKESMYAEAARAILGQVLEGVFKTVADVPAEYRVENWATISATEVAGRGQGFKGFIVPGIVSLSIMQSALFGVVFTLVRLRNQGVLKRLFATPISPKHFLVGSLTTRLLLLVMQTYVLLFVGILVAGVEVSPGYALFWLEVIPLIFLGGIVFASLGLAISGIAKTENTAAPLANIVSLPMMFLSGVFIPQGAMPDWLVAFAKWLPLTFLADAMRAMVNSGETLFVQTGPLLGLAVWAAICFALAVWAFRWE